MSVPTQLEIRLDLTMIEALLKTRSTGSLRDASSEDWSSTSSLALNLAVQLSNTKAFSDRSTNRGPAWASWRKHSASKLVWINLG